MLNLLLEGSSIRLAERLPGVHLDTIMRLVVRAGRHCARLMEDHIRNFHSSVLELGKAWTYVQTKHTKDAQLKVQVPQEELGRQ